MSNEKIPEGFVEVNGYLLSKERKYAIFYIKHFLAIGIISILLVGGLIYAAAVTSSPYDGTGWNTSAPNDEALPGNAYQELQDLRKGVAIRMNKEHVTLASSSAGGEHVPGGCAVLAYESTGTIDTNDSGVLLDGDAIHDALAYDTTLLKFITFDATGENVVDLLVGTEGIADANVTLAKMDVNSVDSDQYVDGSIDSAHFSTGCVLTDDIADANVTTAKIADANVTVAKIDFFLDEDNMASDDATSVASQQSIKKYVDDQITANAAAANSLCKGWAKVASNGTLAAGYNATSARDSAGHYTITWGTDFADGDYVVVLTPGGTGEDFFEIGYSDMAAGSIGVDAYKWGIGYTDIAFCIVAFGAQ